MGSNPTPAAFCCAESRIVERNARDSAPAENSGGFRRGFSLKDLTWILAHAPAETLEAWRWNLDLVFSA